MKRKRSRFSAVCKLVLFALLISFLAPAFPGSAAGVEANAFSINCYTGVKIMPVGDSITKGSHSIGIVGYRKPLYDALAAKFGAGNIDFVGSASDGSFAQPQHNGYSGYHAVNPTMNSIDDFIKTWLNATPADIVLLHIGTNDIDDVYSANEIATILDLIDDYSTDVYVILALIINRKTFSPATASFNNDVEAMANARIASGDLITIVDMENELNYSTDMDDDKHPNDDGYGKMANVWFDAIDELCGAPSVTDPGPQSSAEGETISPLQIVASDPTIQTLTYSQTGLPPDLEIDPGSGLIGGTISYDAYTGALYDVTVTVTDTDNNQTSVDFTWTITNTNRAPQVNQPASQFHAEGASVNLQIVASDPDVGNVLQFSVSNLPPGLMFNQSNGWITGAISYEAYTGTHYTVQVTATDNGSPVLSDSKTFTWTITNVNRSPVFDFLPGNQADNEGEAVSLQILASDPDPEDTLSYSADGLPEELAIDPASGLISGILSYNASIGSPHPVSITISDGSDQETANLTWQVVDRNGAPQVSNPGSQTNAEVHPADLQIQASDPDLNDSITFSLGEGSFLPDGLLLDPETGVISGVIAAGAAVNSPYWVTVIVKDSGSPQLSGNVTFDWNVAPYNQPPVDTTIVFLPVVFH